MKKLNTLMIGILSILFLSLSANTFAQKASLEGFKGKFELKYQDASPLQYASTAATENYVFGFSTDGSVATYAVFITTDPSVAFPVSPFFPFESLIGTASEMVVGEPFKFYSTLFDVDLGAYSPTYLVNPIDGSVTPLGTITGVGGIIISAMALDHATGIYYICDDLANLYTVDMTTLVATLVGNMGTGSYGMAGMTFDGDGNLWGFESVFNAIVSIDKTTGWASLVGYTGIVNLVPEPFAHGMAWDPVTDKVVMIASSGALESAYYSVNITTGEATLIGPIDGILFTECTVPTTICSMEVYLEDSDGNLKAGGSLEYREGGGSGWQDATELEDGVFCVVTDRDQVGLRMTYGPQVLKVSEVPTNTDYTFEMEKVFVKLREGGELTDNGEVSYTSDGWYYIGMTGDNGTGQVSLDMLPTTYTFRMSYSGDIELKQRDISPSYNKITFHVEELSSAELSSEFDFEIVAYPNPFSGNTTIAYSLDQSQEIEIAVYDQTGRLVEVLHEGLQTEGNHKMNWNASQVNKGVYFVRLSANGKVAHKNIVKM